MPRKASTRGTPASQTGFVKSMADGLNEARAMRIAEVMNDYQMIQHRISQYQVIAPQQDYNEEGYVILRQCRAEAQAVLAAPYDYQLLEIPRGPGETEKRQLQRILLDASARRFQAQKIYLRAAAAIRWANTRNTILQGHRPSNGSLTALLQSVDRTLRTELGQITDERIVTDFRRADTAAGHYLSEDPPLSSILSWIHSH